MDRAHYWPAGVRGLSDERESRDRRAAGPRPGVRIGCTGRCWPTCAPHGTCGATTIRSFKDDFARRTELAHPMGPVDPRDRLISTHCVEEIHCRLSGVIAESRATRDRDPLATHRVAATCCPVPAPAAPPARSASARWPRPPDAGPRRRSPVREVARLGVKIFLTPLHASG